MKILNQKNGVLNEQDRLLLSQLLLKAGYTVRLVKEKKSQNHNAPYIHFIELWGDNENTLKGV